jgi:putative ABC transport system permease protein
MSLFRLMRLYAWRKPLRTVLLMFSVAVAFLIYGLTAGFVAGLQGSDGADESRLVVISRNGKNQPLPLSHFKRVAGDPDVAAAAYAARIRGYVGSERNGVVASAVDPADMAGIMGRELGLTPVLLAELAVARDRVLVGRSLADAMGWRPGERVALTPFEIMRADGGGTWSFEIGGIFEGARADVDTHFMLARYDYVNAARRRDRDTIDGILVVPRASLSPDALAARIDALFASSAAPTRTQSEKAFLAALIRQIADFSLIVSLVTSAAFVTILMIVVNTMVFAVRERRFEFGVLKALGFSSSRVMALVMAETLFVFAAGGFAGLGLAAVGSILVGPEFGLAVTLPVLIKAGLILLTLGLLAGLLPAMSAMRTPVANALRSR